jgi:hypothetical protein
MNELRLSLAPAGALILRPAPEFDLERALERAVIRLARTEHRRKRRAKNLEGTMYPVQHNFFASPAQGSTLNAGQFGSTFAQHPCRGCENKLQAYDAEKPARPQRSIKQLLTAAFSRATR